MPSAGFIGHHGEAFGYYGSADDGGYSFGRLRDQACEVKHEYAVLFGAISVIGFANWDWGSASFSFNSEGWFSEENTGSGGMDKLGHAFASYAITDFLTYRIRRDSPDPRHAELTAGLLSLSLMT